MLREVKHVLDIYDVKIEYKHLSLIADYMTHTGSYLALSRHGVYPSLYPHFLTFREAIDDFSFKGYSTPKGFKLYWSATATHKNSKIFPEPEKFNPSRFQGAGPTPYTFVPLGGGPRMCPGLQYARFEIQVFMHHLVKRFKFEKVLPNDEKFVVDPMPIPAKGLPIRLYPLQN